MRIRTKLTLLLIVFSLGPLLIAGLFDSRVTERLGRDLAGRTASTLNSRAESQLELSIARMADRVESRVASIETAADMIASAIDAETSRPASPAPGGGIVPGLIEPEGWAPPDPTAERAVLARVAPIAMAYHESSDGVQPQVNVTLRSGLAMITPSTASTASAPQPDWAMLAQAPPRQLVRDETGEPFLLLTRRAEGGGGAVRISVPLDRAAPFAPLPQGLALDARAQLAQLPAAGPDANPSAALLHADVSGAAPRWRAVQQGDPELLELVEAPLRDRRAYTVADPGGTTNAVVVAGPLLDLGDRGMLAILLSVPRDVLTADAARVTEDVRLRTSQQTMRTLVTALLVLLIAILTAYFAAKTVTRRIKRLESVTGRVAEGDLSARANAKGRDEVARLARNFNDMIPRVEEGLRLRQSAELAGELERRAMPSGDATVRGFDVHAEARYCQQVGGDCIDHFSGPGSDIVIVADIAGTGVSAALVTHAVRAVLRAGAEAGRDAADLMTELNAAVRRESARENMARFIKLFYLEVAHADGRIRWCSAGHDAAYAYAPERDEFTPLASAAPPLGVDDEPGYVVESLDPPAPGTLFYFGTDGVWEAQDPSGSPIGRERVLDLIRAEAARPAREIAGAVLDAVERHRAGTEAHDDLAFVILRAEAHR